MAKLFRATAEAETVHAHTHLHVLKGVGGTVDNLKAAIEGETHEFKHMYPKMIEEAQAEGDKQAERTFRFANEVEKIHAALYEKALADPAGLKQTEYLHLLRVRLYLRGPRSGQVPGVPGGRESLLQRGLGGDMDKWECPCGYVYDPAEGDVEHGVSPGTSWEAVPDDWLCPKCAAEKEYFEKAGE